MKYCINCGKSLTEEEAFCKHCGLQVKKKPIQKETEPHPVPQEPQSRQPEKKVSKKTKIIIGSFITVIILLFAAYKTIEHLNRPTKLVESFTESFDDKDITSVNTYLKQANTDTKIDEKETKKFIDYLHEHPDELNELKKSLKEEATDLEQNISISSDADYLLSVQKQGKKWILFDNYVIQPKAIYLNLSANENNIAATMGESVNKKLKKGEKEYTIGPFLPYEYTIKATNKTDFATVEVKETKDPINDLSDKYISFDFNVEGDYVDIYTDYSDATIFINGKSTGVTVAENSTIQPIQTDGSMRIYLERESGGKKIKSNSVTLNSSNANESLDIYFDSYDSEEDELYSYDDDEDTSDVDNKYEIEQVIKEHYHNIENGDFQSAYEFFSSKKRSEITADEWSSAYPLEIHENTPTVHHVELVDDSHALAEIDLYSHSEDDDGSEDVKNFSGELHFVKENGEWKFDKSKLKEE